MTLAREENHGRSPGHSERAPCDDPKPTAARGNARPRWRSCAALAIGVAAAIVALGVWASTRSHSFFGASTGFLRVIRDEDGARKAGCRDFEVQPGDRLRFVISGPRGRTAQVLARPKEGREQFVAGAVLDGREHVVPPTAFEVREGAPRMDIVLMVEGEEVARCALSPAAR